MKTMKNNRCWNSLRKCLSYRWKGKNNLYKILRMLIWISWNETKESGERSVLGFPKKQNFVHHSFFMTWPSLLRTQHMQAIKILLSCCDIARWVHGEKRKRDDECEEQTRKAHSNFSIGQKVRNLSLETHTKSSHTFFSLFSLFFHSFRYERIFRLFDIAFSSPHINNNK